MSRRVGLVFVAGIVAAVMLVGSSVASAATTLGQTLAPGTCSAETYIQTASPPGGPSYTAPFGGVITQWSYQSDSTPPPTVRLKVAQDFGGGTIKIVAESAVENIAPSTLNTYQSRISMPAGTDLGEYIANDCSQSDATYTDYYADTDLGVGTTSPSFTQEHLQQDISAVLEPDADHDGYGDETQDGCPQQTDTHAACNTSVTVAATPGKKSVGLTVNLPGSGTVSAGDVNDKTLLMASASKKKKKKPLFKQVTTTRSSSRPATSA